MDVVIPLGKTRTDYLDLRYCLRSLEKFGKGLGNIFLVGEKPNWIAKVYWVAGSDDRDEKWKERNIWRKIKRACLLQQLSENFIMFNDDHILIEEVDLENYPYYYKGTCYGSMLKKCIQVQGYDEPY